MSLWRFRRITNTNGEHRHRPGLQLIETTVQDLRYAAAMLRKNSGYAAVAVLTVALGTGANTAIFQLLDALCLRVLPVSRPQELVVVRITDAANERGTFDTTRPAVTGPIWEQIHEHQEAFSGIVAWSDTIMNRSAGAEGRYASGLEVSGDFFNVLGIQPVLGRLLNQDDDRNCGSAVAVISYAFWQRELGGSADVIGMSMMMNDRAFQIVGVTPPGFFGLEVGKFFDVAVPLCAEAILGGASSRIGKGTHWWLTVMGRLKPGWSLEQSSAGLASMSPGVFGATLPSSLSGPDAQHYLDFKLAASPAANGFSDLREAYTTPLSLLLGLAGLIMLIACANLANLMLARTSARERDAAVRLALGASRTRLIRQLMAESLLLACTGAVVGLFLARALSRFLVSFLSQDGDSLFLNLKQDWHVLAFMAALAILTCLLFGSSPALRGSRASLENALKAGSRGLTADKDRFRFGRALLVAQVSISLILVTGALLFVRSLRNLETLDPGFQEDGVLIANVALRRLNLTPPRLIPFKRELVERLSTVPGVEAAADTDVAPLSSANSTTAWMDGSSAEEGINLEYGQAGPDYFKTLGIRLLAGRTFDGRDILSSQRVAIVNRMFARQFTDGSNPIGRRFWVDATPYDRKTPYEIIGLVENTRHEDLHNDFAPMAFLASSQDRHPEAHDQILIRSSTPAATILSSVKSALVQMNPEIIISFQVLETEIHNSLQRERLMAMLSGFFGVLALVLASVGLYGVLSYNVAGRTTEIGIRMALGARAAGVLWLILRESLLLVFLGVALAIPALLVGTRVIASLLFRLKPGDPVSIAIAALVMFAVAAAAAFIPARRASRVDPIVALRNE